MNREQLLSELEKEYANIYEFTGNFGDAPLNVLDDFMTDAGLGEEAETILYDMVDEIDSKSLSDNMLARLLEIYKQVVDECKFEFQD